MKIVIVTLTAIVLGLGVGFFIQHHQASLVINATERSRDTYSNSWEQTKIKLDEVEKVAATLETNLNVRTEALTASSNDLAKANGELAKTQIDYTAAQAEMKKQQTQIADLETQRDELTKKMGELTNSIASLEIKIADTKKKLATAEGDRSFLLKELAQMQTEKAALVAQFNNLAALRSQVAKLKEAAAVNQRLAWMQMGGYNLRDKKGAERLLTTAPAASKPDSRLEIELEQNGRGKVAPNAAAPVGP